MAVSPDKVEAFAKALDETGVIGKAMRRAGYSDSAADRGKAHLPPPMLTAVQLWEAAQEKIKLGQQLTKDSADGLIKGRLAETVISGKDTDAVAAAKALGSHKDYDLFTQERSVGVMMVLPQGVLDVITERLQGRAPVALPPVIDALPSDDVPPTED